MWRGSAASNGRDPAADFGPIDVVECGWFRLGNITDGEPGLIPIGNLHRLKRVFRHSGLCGRLFAKLYSVNISVVVLVETFDDSGLTGFDHFDDVIVCKFSGCAHGHEV
jgi:hypothetical protein